MKNTQIIWSLGSINKRIYELLILIFSSVYVFSQTSVRIGVSEDPVFHNGSYLVNNLFSAVGDDQRGLLTEGYKTLVIPYGIASWILNLFTSDPVWHFRYQLFIHVLIILFSIYFVLISISSKLVALLLAVFAFSTQAFYEQVLYSIGASQVLLIASATALFITLKQVSAKRFVFFSCGSLLLSISLWSNIPQLLSTWLAVLLIMVFGVIGSENRKSVIARSTVFCLIAFVVYLPPLLSLLSDLQFYSNTLSGLSINGGGFGNSGPISVLQGMGKWSLNDYNWSVPHYEADLVLWRQLIRAIPASLVFLAFLSITILKPEVKFLDKARVFMVFFPVFAFMTSVSNLPLFVWIIGVLVLVGTIHFLPNRVPEIIGKSLVREPRVFLMFSMLGLVFYSLSLIGHYDWYWVLRQNFTLLTMFREPWAKFSIPFVFFLCCAMAVLISKLQFHLRNRYSMRLQRTFPVVIAALVFSISLPMFSNHPVAQMVSGKRIEFVSLSLDYWRVAHKQIIENDALLSTSTICVLNLDPRNSGQMLVRTKFPKNSKLSNLLSKYSNTGEDCTQDRLNLKLIILSGEGLRIGNSYNIKTGAQWCINKKSNEFFFIDKKCGIKIEKTATGSYLLTIDPYVSKVIVPS